MALKTLTKIAQSGNVDLAWLLTGEGPMEKEEKPLAGPGMAPHEGALAEVEVYVLAGAGAARDLVSPEPIEKVVVPKEWLRPGMVAVRVVGESMEPTFYDGAVVGMDKDDCKIVSGKVYAVWLPYEGAVVKRIYTEPDAIIIKSDNPGFPTSRLNIKDVEETLILGRGRWVVQRL